MEYSPFVRSLIYGSQHVMKFRLTLTLTLSQVVGQRDWVVTLAAGGTAGYCEDN